MAISKMEELKEEQL